MPIKVIADKKSELPEHLQDSAVEVDGKFEVDGSGLVKKNKELVTDNNNLNADKRDLTEKLSAFDGKVAVSVEVKDLGEAAQSAGLKKSEIGSLKTDNAALKTKINGYESAQSLDEVVDIEKLTPTFKKMALKEGWNFEKASEKQGADTIEFFNIVKADGSKQKVQEFIDTDDYAKDFADKFRGTEERTGFQFGEQGGDKTKNVFDKIREREKAKEEKPANDLDKRFGKS